MPRHSSIFVATRNRGRKILVDSLLYAIPHLLRPSKAREPGANSIYLGVELDLGEKVFWSPANSLTAHVLVIGPSGSGKTVTLSAIASRIAKRFGGFLTIFDVKGEYSDLTKLEEVMCLEFDPFRQPIPLCVCGEDDKIVKAEMELFTSLLERALGLLSSAGHRSRVDALTYLCKRCEPLDRLQDLLPAEEGRLESLQHFFDVYHEEPEHARALLHNNVIVNLKTAFAVDRRISAFIATFLIKKILGHHEAALAPSIQRVLVLDEVWHVMPYLGEELGEVLTRYTRSYGVYVAMATHNIDDLHPLTEVLVGNSGLLVALASPSQSYWLRLAKFLNLSRRGVERALNLHGQGEAVARLQSLRAPLFLYVDPFNFEGT